MDRSVDVVGDPHAVVLRQLESHDGERRGRPGESVDDDVRRTVQDVQRVLALGQREEHQVPRHLISNGMPQVHVPLLSPGRGGAAPRR